MKTKTQHLLTVLALSLTTAALQAGTPAAIPADQLGAAAQAAYQGDGISIQPVPGGAEMRVIFQKLAGHATAEGLWLESTETADKPERFRVRAAALGGESPQPLPVRGTVSVAEDHARYARPGLAEEYRVSMDGVRQDFVVAAPPADGGGLNVWLEISGAKAAPAAYGARLTLDGSGRTLAYSRLHVTDARDRVLPARMEVTSADRLVIRVDDAGAAYPVRIDPTFSDEDWISLGGVSSVSGQVYAMVLDGGNLYVGGTFLEVGELESASVARWDGTNWSALGDGVNGTVNAMVVHDSKLYVGGDFPAAGGNPARNLAVWDMNTSSWSEVGGGVNSIVYALLYDEGLIVGGQFSEAGGVSADGIAKWNGTWITFNEDPPNLQMTYALAVYGGQLIIGGYSGVFFWDGAVWQPLGGGVSSGSNIDLVRALIVSPDGSSLYAGGNFTSAGGSPAARIARWDGTAWSALGSGLSHDVLALAWEGDDLLAGGGFIQAGGQSASRLARWDGSSWAAVMPAETLNGDVHALAVAGGDVILGGIFTQATTIHSRGLARWDGSTLQRMAGKGLNGEVKAVLVAGADIYFGGLFTNAGSMIARRIVKWNGSAWSALGQGMSTGQVNALARIGTDIYAGGTFTTAGGVSASRIAKWDGSAWSALGSGASAEVKALAVMGTDLFAGGAFSSAGGVAGTGRVARWDGTAWNALNSGLNLSSGVYAMLVKGSDLYVGGLLLDNDAAAPANLNGVARWDGTAWHALPGVTNTVHALAADGDDLLIGGSFTNSGGSTVNNIVRWNGATLSALGSGVNGRVQAIAVHSTGIYAGGIFTAAGGSPVGRIARWDGTSWRAMGSGLLGGSAEVNALAVSGDSLVVGGFFGVVGGKVSTHAALANWVFEAATSVISFNQPVYEVNQGAVTAAITLVRTNATEAASVRFSTANGTSNANPPFYAGRSGIDYVAQGSTLVEFAAGEASKTITISLIPRTGSVPNIRFRIALNNPSENAVIGLDDAEVYILADDTTPPTLTITSPAQNQLVTGQPPVSIVGKTGDAKGISRVELSLNGGPLFLASLGASSNPTNIPLLSSMTPAEGANTLIATAYDLQGNSTELVRDFTFSRSYLLTVTRNVPAAVTATPNTAGSITLKADPSSGVTTRLSSATVSPQTARILPGTEIKLTATPKSDYLLSHWSGLPPGAVQSGTSVTFTMPAEDVPDVTAVFIANPLPGLGGTRVAFLGHLRAFGTTPVSNATTGFLTSTLTTRTGALTGKVLLDGATTSFSARVHGNGSVWFKVGGVDMSSLAFGTRVLTLEVINGNLFSMEVVNTANGDILQGLAKPAIYSAANPVPAALINEPAAIPQPNGYYTLALPPVVQTPPMDTSTYPKGAGYATLNIAGHGGLKLSGVLADGTKFTAASALVEGDVAPFFGQLPTPGNTSVKGGSIGGDLLFDASQPDSDILGADMLWLRPAAAVNLYPSGWPSGIAVDVIGALYDKTAGAQTLLGMGPVDPATGNGRLTFSEGTLAATVVKTNFNVNGNQVIKVPPVPVDRSFNLTISNGLHGTFRGDFVPSGSTLKLKYYGLIVSKGALRGGFGYFLSSPISASPPQSGHALLEARTP